MTGVMVLTALCAISAPPAEPVQAARPVITSQVVVEVRVYDGDTLTSAPTLVAVSGEPARIEVGGTVAATFEEPDGRHTETIPVGLTLTAVPTVLESGKIHLRLAMEHREVDTETRGNRSLTAIRSSMYETVVTCRNGETIQLGGVSTNGGEVRTGKATDEPSSGRSAKVTVTRGDRTIDVARGRFGMPIRVGQNPFAPPVR
ncbi:type II and III secretion system protein [Stratiformator vulcanicus]|uniref:Bacterial type II and III secretion system protein n=1 Tax=Stratiformator vulcanicus TaxID=2527980 RepID=A0A517QYW5_9PLAN|nr:type II and III secretion system protein [Stratiformator vulcanicus]QDT36839.1 Bacterial type II and III secretion system protein [Stratiformator vulcanicus]